jgi:hypothetical protein
MSLTPEMIAAGIQAFREWQQEKIAVRAVTFLIDSNLLGCRKSSVGQNGREFTDFTSVNPRNLSLRVGTHVSGKRAQMQKNGHHHHDVLQGRKIMNRAINSGLPERCPKVLFFNRHTPYQPPETQQVANRQAHSPTWYLD